MASSDKAEGLPFKLSFEELVEQHDTYDIGALPDMGLKMLADLKHAADGEVNTEVAERLNLTAQNNEMKAWEEGSSPNFKAIIYITMPALDAHTIEGLRKRIVLHHLLRHILRSL